MAAQSRNSSYLYSSYYRFTAKPYISVSVNNGVYYTSGFVTTSSNIIRTKTIDLLTNTSRVTTRQYTHSRSTRYTTYTTISNTFTSSITINVPIKTVISTYSSSTNNQQAEFYIENNDNFTYQTETMNFRYINMTSFFDYPGLSSISYSYSSPYAYINTNNIMTRQAYDTVVWFSFTTAYDRVTAYRGQSTTTKTNSIGSFKSSASYSFTGENYAIYNNIEINNVLACGFFQTLYSRTDGYYYYGPGEILEIPFFIISNTKYKSLYQSLSFNTGSYYSTTQNRISWYWA